MNWMHFCHNIWVCFRRTFHWNNRVCSHGFHQRKTCSMNWVLHIGSCRRASSGRRPNQLTLRIRTTFCQAISLQLSLSAKNCPIPSTNCPPTLITFREHTSFSSGVLSEQLWIFARFSVNFCPILRGCIRTAVHTMQLPISHNNAVFYAHVIALEYWKLSSGFQW